MAIGIPMSADEALAIGKREGWLAQRSNRGGLFEVVELWVSDHGAPPLLFLAVPLVGMVVFAALVGSALYLRRHPAAHKRLMMLATLELVTAGVSRLPIVDSWGPVGFFAVTDLFLLAMIVYDWRALGRVHTATLLGGAFLIASQPLRLILGATGIWTAFATWLVA